MRPFLLLFALLVGPTAASAVVLGGSNWGPLERYPDPKCDKPLKPQKPFDLSEEFQVEMYNSRVRAYNVEMQHYYSCVERYLNNANKDIERIKEKMEKVADEAEQPQF